MACAASAAQFRCRDRQHWPQSLAAGINKMMRKLGNQVDIRYRLVENDTVYRCHVGPNQGQNTRETL